MIWLGEFGALLLVLGFGAGLATLVFHAAGGAVNEGDRNMVTGLYLAAATVFVVGCALFVVWFVTR